MSDTNVHRVVGNLLVGTSHFFVDTTTNQVGINTSSPSASLDVATGDVKVGSGITLANNGTITATGFSGDGSLLENVAGDSGSWVNGTNSNVHLATLTDKVGIGVVSPGAELHVGGTGAIIVPAGTTGERPGTGVNGMIRYNSTIDNIEVYTAGVWSPLTQPPTITGISPLTTLTSGGQVAATGHQQDLLLLSDVSGYPVAADWRFGNAVDISSDGTYAVVGMWNAWSGNSRGQAFVYKRTGTTWVFQAVLYDDSSSDPAANGDNFGKCVSISSDGRYVLVGAEYDTINGTYGAGSAHVWYRQSDTGNGSWQYQQEITHPIPSQMGNYGIFGASLDLSGDGVWAVISARQDSPAGKAYIYKRTNTTWSYVAQIAPANNNNGENNWGKTVQLSSDGLYVLATCSKTDVGGSDTGSVFIFKRGASDSTWTLQQTLYHPTPQADSDFGGWYSESGQAAAFSSDATYVAIGSPNRDIGSVTNAGIVSIFKRTDATWAWEADLTHPTPNAADPGPNANFGDSLDISADGTMVVVGVPGRSEGGSGYTGAGSAQVYKRTGTTWAHFSEFLNNGAGVSHSWQDDYFGRSVAISGDKKYIICGAPKDDTTKGTTSGSAHIFIDQDEITDASTQVFTVTGTGITLGSTVKLVGADGETLYDVFDVTTPTGTQVTFKMGALGTSGGFVVANQPYKVRIESASGLNTTSTAQIGFSPTWTTAALTDLNFDVGVSGSQTIEGTDGGGLTTNRMFSVQSGNLPANLGLDQGSGAIQGIITTSGTTQVVFRLSDTNTSLFVDRTFNIVGTSPLYNFSSHTFTPCGASYRSGPTLTEARNAYSVSVPPSPATPWDEDTNLFNILTTERGIQRWTVPKTGVYTIQVKGARGAWYSAGPAYGATLQGNFNLSVNQVIKIAVGQQGRGSNNPGGGGGTFVWIDDPPNNPLIIAGGGGGVRDSNWDPSNASGQSGQNAGQCGTTNGVQGGGVNLCSNPGHTVAVGHGSWHSTTGTVMYTSSCSGGGAGWLSEGADAQSGQNSSQAYAGFATPTGSTGTRATNSGSAIWDPTWTADGGGGAGYWKQATVICGYAGQFGRDYRLAGGMRTSYPGNSQGTASNGTPVSTLNEKLWGGYESCTISETGQTGGFGGGGGGGCAGEGGGGGYTGGGSTYSTQGSGGGGGSYNGGISGTTSASTGSNNGDGSCTITYVP